MRVAAVSTDGIHVDGHFGKAKRFLVFDLSPGGIEAVAERPVSPLSTGDAGHPFNPGRLAAIVETLEDCRRVYRTRIGEKPATELSRRGIQAVVYQGPIDRIEP